MDIWVASKKDHAEVPGELGGAFSSLDAAKRAIEAYEQSSLAWKDRSEGDAYCDTGSVRWEIEKCRLDDPLRWVKERWF